MPELDFEILSAEPRPYAVVPTLLFQLHITNRVEGETVYSVMLMSEVQVQAPQRRYDLETKERLYELFGPPEMWSETLRNLYWGTASAVVSKFVGGTTIALALPCTYDADMTIVKYCEGLQEGEIPLVFFFSGSAFYQLPGGAFNYWPIPTTKEASFKLPIGTWRGLIQSYYGDSRWLRVKDETFERVDGYRKGRLLPTLDDALNSLVEGASKGGEQ